MRRGAVLLATLLTLAALAFAPPIRYKPIGIAQVRSTVGIVAWDRLGARACLIPLPDRRTPLGRRIKMTCGIVWWAEDPVKKRLREFTGPELTPADTLMVTPQ